MTDWHGWIDRVISGALRDRWTVREIGTRTYCINPEGGDGEHWHVTVEIRPHGPSHHEENWWRASEGDPEEATA
jgi:hypothetical protein